MVPEIAFPTLESVRTAGISSLKSALVRTTGIGHSRAGACLAAVMDMTRDNRSRIRASRSPDEATESPRCPTRNNREYDENECHCVVSFRAITAAPTCSAGGALCALAFTLPLARSAINRPSEIRVRIIVSPTLSDQSFARPQHMFDADGTT